MGYPQSQQQKYSTSGTASLSSSHRSRHGNHSQQQSQDYMSVGSHYSRGSVGSSHNSSQVDEAYRRLGQRLSMRAHGDLPVSKPRLLARIGMTPKSGFVPHDQTSLLHTFAVEGQQVSSNLLVRFVVPKEIPFLSIS